MKEIIELKVLNELMSNNTKNKYLVQTQQGHIGIPDSWGDGNQGEYNEAFKFYKHPGLPEGVFMKETYHTDSYGERDSLVDVQFVKGKEKTITVFEPI